MTAVVAVGFVVTAIVAVAVSVSVIAVGRRQRSLPAREIVHAGGVEQVGAEQTVGIDRGKLRADRLGVGLERTDEFFSLREFRLATAIGLVQQDEVRDLELLDEQIRKRTVVLAPGSLRPLLSREGLEEGGRVEDRYERVDVVKRGDAGLGREQPGDGRGFGDARRLDDEVVEGSVASQPDHGGLEVVLKLTADTAVRELCDAVVELEFRPSATSSASTLTSPMSLTGPPASGRRRSTTGD